MVERSTFAPLQITSPKYDNDKAWNAMTNTKWWGEKGVFIKANSNVLPSQSRVLFDSQPIWHRRSMLAVDFHSIFLTVIVIHTISILWIHMNPYQMAYSLLLSDAKPNPRVHPCNDGTHLVVNIKYLRCIWHDNHFMKSCNTVTKWCRKYIYICRRRLPWKYRCQPMKTLVEWDRLQSVICALRENLNSVSLSLSLLRKSVSNVAGRQAGSHLLYVQILD